MITLKEVAKLAGVGVSTVSHALNGTGTVSDETRQRIIQLAEELNYHPNGVAKRLRSKKTNTIGVFISNFGGAFYEDILQGIHLAVKQKQYELIVCPESETTHKILTHRQVDGAIVFDSTIKDDLLKRLANIDFPIVTLDRVLGVENTYPLLIDNRHGAMEVFRYFYQSGFRKIIYISGVMEAYDNMERMEAFLEEAQRHEIPVKTFIGNFTEMSGYQTAKTIISMNDLPDAVFCANDQMAIGFIKAMEEFHLKAPNDIAVVGFDDISIAKYLNLSTVGVSRTDWGYLAALQLVNLIEDGTPFSSYKIRAKFIERATSKKENTNGLS
jgi:LacI family transcriptional regulator